MNKRRYHLRCPHTFKPFNDQGQTDPDNPDSFIRFERALKHAYDLSAVRETEILVCRNSGTVDQPAYTPLATVGCLV